MEPKPLIVVTSSRTVSKRRALKAIDSFLELHEESKNCSTDVSVERYRISAIPEDVIMSLVKVKTFLIEDVIQPSSSAVKSEVLKGAKKSVGNREGDPVISETKIKLEDEGAQVIKKTKRTAANDDHPTEKKKKARL